MKIDEQIFRVGSFNLYNLVLPEEKYYGKRSYSQEEYDKKIEWIGEKFEQMQAEIIGFQEIFHEEALQAAIDKCTLYREATTVVANPTGKSPVVGLVSCFPVLDTEIIAEFPRPLDIEGVDVPITHFSRPVLKATLDVHGQKMHVFVAHLKSKRPAFAEGVNRRDPAEYARGQARSLIRRAAEAAAFREILMASLEHRKMPVLVLGDLNDNHLSVTTRMISGTPPFRRMPFEEKKRLWDVLLYHAKEIQARRSYQDFYYSHIHNGHYESLDHIMVSEELVAENPDHIGKVGYVYTINDHLVDETFVEGGVKPWQSDHAQVVATIELRNAEGKGTWKD